MPSSGLSEQLHTSAQTGTKCIIQNRTRLKSKNPQKCIRLGVLEAETPKSMAWHLAGAFLLPCAVMESLPIQDGASMPQELVSIIESLRLSINPRLGGSPHDVATSVSPQRQSSFSLHLGKSRTHGKCTSR